MIIRSMRPITLWSARRHSECLSLAPLACSHLIASLGGFTHVREAAPEEWLVFGDRVRLAEEGPRRWRDGFEENVRDVLAQIDLPCPSILLQEAPAEEHQAALLSVCAMASRCVRPSNSEGRLELELIVPAVQMPDGPRLLVIARERWSRRLN